MAKPSIADSSRVFVIGESAAMGVPEPGFAIAPQLQAQLRAAYPGKKVEVFNLGITAINSHTVRDIVRQAVQLLRRTGYSSETGKNLPKGSRP